MLSFLTSEQKCVLVCVVYYNNVDRHFPGLQIVVNCTNLGIIEPVFQGYTENIYIYTACYVYIVICVLSYLFLTTSMKYVLSSSEALK